MESSLINIEESTAAFPVSFEKVRSTRYEYIWQQLSKVYVSEALTIWLDTLGHLTAKNYGAGFKRLSAMKLIDLSLSLQHFSLVNHEAVIDQIKTIQSWSEATRQARAAAYISFTGFLQRRTKGIIGKAVTNKEGTNKTFFKIREKVKTPALSRDQTRKFMSALEKLNSRDALIAKLLLQGGKRKEEVLSLQTHNIDFSKNRISFRQTKTRGMEKDTIINYPDHIMADLRQFINGRTGLAFVTKNSKKISPFQIDRNFLIAGERANIPFRVTPHVLRVTLVTRLKELKIQDTDIMKITGHANPAQLSSYDKTDLAENATLYHHLV